jgi:hypothetical protein
LEFCCQKNVGRKTGSEKTGNEIQGANHMRDQDIPKIGETVQVRLFADQIVTGKVVCVWQDAEGTRVRILRGAIVNNVMLEQIVR